MTTRGKKVEALTAIRGSILAAAELDPAELNVVTLREELNISRAVCEALQLIIIDRGIASQEEIEDAVVFMLNEQCKQYEAKLSAQSGKTVIAAGGQH